MHVGGGRDRTPPLPDSTALRTVIDEMDRNHVVAVVLFARLAVSRTLEWSSHDSRFLEEVLIRHPRLRVNLMHAGLPFLASTLATMRRYPQVYVDLGLISNANSYPIGEFQDYLRALMRADLGKRIMFGSDAAGPGGLGPSLEGVAAADFLTEPERRDILCDNAARFFRLGANGKPAVPGSRPH